MEYNRKLSASCVVIKDDKVLLVKHTYGPAKGKYLIPGGFSEEGELPEQTAEREVQEETGVCVKANGLVAVRFTREEIWCIFNATYISGTPASDNCENSEAIFMPLDDMFSSDNVVDTTKEIVKCMLDHSKAVLRKSDFVNKNHDEATWQLFI